MSTIAQQITEAQNQLERMERVYAHYVRQGVLLQRDADARISLQQDIVTTLQAVALADAPGLFPTEDSHAALP
jgi:hypothetical protein